MLRRRGTSPRDVHRGARVHVGLHREGLAERHQTLRSDLDRRGLGSDGHRHDSQAAASRRADGLADVGDVGDAGPPDRRSCPPTRHRTARTRWQPYRCLECVDSGASPTWPRADGMAVPAHRRRVGASKRGRGSLAGLGAVWRRRHDLTSRRQRREPRPFLVGTTPVATKVVAPSGKAAIH
ncbi:MAG: hypothetical protein JWO36_785 [Myxococcales bacterium]|nr:hypothetical protein [Myxococcales bacterium]